MDRRSFLAGLAAAFPATAIAAAAPPSRAESRTDWIVRTSEGFDALAFLGPLSGEPLYQRYYRDDAAAFGARLPIATVDGVRALWSDAAKAGFGLLGPSLSVLYSGEAADRSLEALIAATANPDSLLPRYRASQYWDEKDWGWFVDRAPALRSILEAMAAASFASFRAGRIGDGEARARDVASSLRRYDLIRLHEKLTGRPVEPRIEVVLLQFSKPHGIKVQGQRFLQAIDYDTAATVRIAAHEMLHPPVPMDGAAARAALAVLEKDELIQRIAREHDPKWGYTTVEGLLNEDLCQALDQLISEELGVARNPADRWRKADDGIHVLAAAFYGMLRQDRWIETGGSIEQWLANAAAGPRLHPTTLHYVAARVLERSPAQLWPLPAPSLIR